MQGVGSPVGIGNDQNKSIWGYLLGILLVVILSAPGIAWILSVGDVTLYWRYDVPAGQFPYVLSKLFGLYAFMLLAMQMIYGALGADLRSQLSVEMGNAFHRKLGIAVLLLIIAHVACFLVGPTLRVGHFPIQYLTPEFSAGYYRSRITLGIFSLILIVVAVIGILIRTWSNFVGKWMHRLVFVSIVLGALHGFSIGSETRDIAVIFVYSILLIGLLGVSVWRVFRSSVKG